jgi:hypothetical protein
VVVVVTYSSDVGGAVVDDVVDEVTPSRMLVDGWDGTGSTAVVAGAVVLASDVAVVVVGSVGESAASTARRRRGTGLQAIDRGRHRAGRMVSKPASPVRTCAGGRTA